MTRTTWECSLAPQYWPAGTSLLTWNSWRRRSGSCDRSAGVLRRRELGCRSRFGTEPGQADAAVGSRVHRSADGAGDAPQSACAVRPPRTDAAAVRSSRVADAGSRRLGWVDEARSSVWSCLRQAWPSQVHGATVICALAVAGVWGARRRHWLTEHVPTGPYSWRAAVWIVPALVAAPLILAPSITRIFGITDFARRNVVESDVGRSKELGRAISDIASSPWTGVGSDRLLSAHNVGLQVLASGGLLLLAACVPLMFLAVRGVFGAVPSASSAAVVAWLCFGLVQNSIIDRFVHVVVMLAVVTWVRQERTWRPSADQVRRWLKSPFTPKVSTRP